MIKESILIRYHASVAALNKGDMLFQQGDAASSFYIVKSGKIKMSNYSDGWSKLRRTSVLFARTLSCVCHRDGKERSMEDTARRIPAAVAKQF
jgi:CRP-like cAMP-binding protein